MTREEEAWLNPMFDERPIVLLVHAVNDLIRAGFHVYPAGRAAIIHVLEALTSLLRLADLNRLRHEDIRAFVDDASSRIDIDPPQ